MEYIDLRSDTVTQPTPQMREAMATAAARRLASPCRVAEPSVESPVGALHNQGCQFGQGITSTISR